MLNHLTRKEGIEMRIGIDARFYGSLGKGLGRYTEKLIGALEILDQKNEYFIFLRKENFNDYISSSPRFHKILADERWYSWREQLIFPWTLKKFQLDLVHFPHFNVPFFYRKPFVVTIHDLILLHYPTIKASELPPALYWMKYWIYRFVIHSAIRRSQAVLTVSQFTEKDILQNMPRARGKIVLTPEAADAFCSWSSGHDVKSFLQSVQLWNSSNISRQKEGPCPFILYVGNAYPHKNLDLLLACARKFPAYTFVCVGKEDFFYRILKKKVRDMSLGNVSFLGFVSDRNLGILYRSAQVFFFPSLYEGFGLPALEALSYGLPVLAAHRGALPEIIGKAGVLFHPKHLDDVVSKLQQILSDDFLRANLRRDGFAQICNFHWMVMAQLTHSVYEQVGKKLSR